MKKKKKIVKIRKSDIRAVLKQEKLKAMPFQEMMEVEDRAFSRNGFLRITLMSVLTRFRNLHTIIMEYNFTAYGITATGSI